MSVNNSIYMKTFNNQFFELCDDIHRVFPNEITIPQAKNLAMMVKKTNPKLLISIWHRYISLPYKEVMLNSSVDECTAFLLAKDYTHDVRNLGKNAQLTLDTFENLREQVKVMNYDDQVKTIKYVTNMIKLSELYYSNGEKHVFYG